MPELMNTATTQWTEPRASSTRTLPAELARLTDAWVVAAFGAALGLRFLWLGDAPLWLDEVTTATWMRESWTSFFVQVLGDNHPPAYYALLKLWSAWAGESAAALRLPSAILSALCVPLIAAAAGQAAGRKAMRWAAWLAAAAPMLVHHGQEARQYALVVFLAAFNLLLLIRFLRTHSGRLGPAFLLISALLAWTHYYGGVLVLAEVLALAATRRADWRRWAPAMAAGSLATFAAALAAYTLAYAEAGGHYRLGPLAIAGVPWALLTEYTLLPTSEQLHASGIGAALPYLPAALLFGGCAALLCWRGAQELSPQVRLPLSVVVAIVILVPYATTFAMQVEPHPRYTLAALPGILVILAASAQRRGRQAPILLGALMLSSVVATALHLNQPAHGREDVRSARAWLDAHVDPRQTILTTSNEMEMLAQFHWPQRRLRLYPEREPVATAAQAAAIAAQLPFADSGGDVIYVVGREWVSDPRGLLGRALRRRYVDCGSAEVRGIRILCLRKMPGE
jgi:uncharacterized membrane protein